jgi:predicted nucleic acid-binding protein
MLDLENADNPYEEKRNAIKIWKDIASVHCKSSPKILETGRIYEKLGITPKDALHIACAVHSGCDYFISTDIKLIRKHIDGIILINPINFIGEAEA